jgi:DNA-binding transcriptional ArsR family regulator
MKPYSRQARLLKSFGHLSRLRLLKLLDEDEACVCHLSAALHLSQPAVSQHLMALRKVGAVSSRRDGKNVYYRLSRPEIRDLLDVLSDMSGAPAASLPPADDCPCPRCQADPDRRQSSPVASKTQGASAS